MSTAKARTRKPKGNGRRYVPLSRNPNKHTQQGTGMLEAAMGRHGYVAPMTAARNGVVLDGNLRLESSATVFRDVEPIVVEHDGTRPVVMVRTDIKDENDPRARDIIVSANRIAEVDLDYDVDVLKGFAADGLDLSLYEFDVRRFGELVDGVDAPELPDGDKGDFEQMTFTLHRDQAFTVRAALDKARGSRCGMSALNENSNGNALAAVCEAYHG